jgi:DNA/RNA endonuclease YhcR with UshA esterase domain
LDEGLRVRLTGEVRQCTTPYPGLTLITLSDPSGEIVVAVDEVVTALTGPLPDIEAGQGITVEGAVTLYRATPQVAPADVADIHLTGRPAATQPTPLTTLRQVRDHPLGATVAAQGTVVLLEGLPGGVRATLDDGTAQVILLLWDRVYHELPLPEALDAGADVAVEGELQSYEGTLEIVPQDAEDVTILHTAPAPPWVEVGALTARDAGHVVRVRGVLGRPQGFSAGIKVPLDDGTGTITVLLWANLYQALNPPPAQDQQIEVVGLVDQYRQELELIPRSVYDWRVRAVDD